MTHALVLYSKWASAGLSVMRRSQCAWSVRVMLRGRCAATERRVVCAAGRRGALSATGASDRQQGGGRARGCGRARAGALTRAVRGAGGPRC